MKGSPSQKANGVQNKLTGIASDFVMIGLMFAMIFLLLVAVRPLMLIDRFLGTEIHAKIINGFVRLAG